MSGTFGCVRSEGFQIHEGIDIRCLTRDRSREPNDPVMATADGTVAYVGLKAGLSNYGRYVILRHEIEGLEIFSLYAHLHSVAPGLAVGKTVEAKEMIARMGRTTNTREGISKDRAHLHFEIDFLGSERFVDWYRKTFPTQRNDHGKWNGQNLLGLDPRLLLLAQEDDPNFRLLQFVKNQKELFRVLIREPQCAWARRFPLLTRRNAIADQQGVAAYELSLNYNGLPFRISPRALSEVKEGARFELLSVDAAEANKHSCRRLVMKKGNRWALTSKGLNHLKLLTY